MSKDKLYAGVNPRDFCCGTVLKSKRGGVWYCCKCKTYYIFDHTGQRFSLGREKRFRKKTDKLSP